MAAHLRFSGLLVPASIDTSPFPEQNATPSAEPVRNLKKSRRPYFCLRHSQYCYELDLSSMGRISLAPGLFSHDMAPATSNSVAEASGTREPNLSG